MTVNSDNIDLNFEIENKELNETEKTELNNLSFETETETEIKTEKRGRKKGSKNKTEVETEPIPDIDFSVLFDIIIKRLNNPIPLTETEKFLINNSSNKVFKKYIPETRYNDEISLGIVLISVFYPRLKKNYKVETVEREIEIKA